MKKYPALLALVLFLVAFLGSLFLFTLPGNKVPSFYWIKIPQLDKFIHAGIFFTLCFTAATAIYSIFHKRIGGLLALIIAGLFLFYGIGVEFYQESVVEGRSFEKLDILADGAGCLLFLVYIRLSRH